MGLELQIPVYTDDMRISQKFLAELMGVTPGTITNWKTKLSEPSLTDLDRLASVTGVTTDWWLGRRTLHKWGSEIEELQAALRDGAPRIRATDMVDRCVQVIQLCQEKSPLCSQAWFMAGVCGLPATDFARLMRDKDDMSPITLSRLADFTQLHEDWLMEGEEGASRPPVSLGRYHVFALRCAEDEIEQAELMANYDWLRRRIMQQRNMMKMPQDAE